MNGRSTWLDYWAVCCCTLKVFENSRKKGHFLGFYHGGVPQKMGVRRPPTKPHKIDFFEKMTRRAPRFLSFLKNAIFRKMGFLMSGPKFWHFDQKVTILTKNQKSEISQKVTILGSPIFTKKWHFYQKPKKWQISTFLTKKWQFWQKTQKVRFYQKVTILIILGPQFWTPIFNENWWFIIYDFM